jgi:MFS family permease
MPAWFVWMGDLIPRRIRGRFLARREQITRLIQFPVAIALAILMDRVIHRDRPLAPQFQPEFVWTLVGLFAVAAAFGVADILLFLRIREVSPTTPDAPRRPAADIHVPPSALGGLPGAAIFAGRYVVAAVRQLLIEPMRDRAFRRYVLFGATAAFAISVGGPFYMRDMRENLQFSHVSLNITFMVLGPLMAILATSYWGRLIDRWGRRPTLMVAMWVAVFGAAPYFFASKYTPNPQWLIDAANALAGGSGRVLGRLAGLFGASVDWSQWRWIPPGAPVGAWLICTTTIFFGFTGWTGVALGQQGIILGFADSHGRSRYVAAYAVLTGLGGVAGAITGGLVAQGIFTASWYHPWRIGQYFELNHWHATFALSMLVRVLAVFALIGMPDPGARRTRDMIRALAAEAYTVSGARLFHVWLGYLRLRRGPRGPGAGPDP